MKRGSRNSYRGRDKNSTKNRSGLLNTLKDQFGSLNLEDEKYKQEELYKERDCNNNKNSLDMVIL